jgi:phosphoribosylformimino-5-aminoimidazole carboxamide ribotide isomerase
LAILRHMIVIPSIDILDGKCVRLFQGDYGKVTDYGDEPHAIAAGFQNAGATRLHVVDLDAARGGETNRSIIRLIREEFKGTIEVGGGIRRSEDIEQLLDVGVDRLIVGTVLAKEPDTVAAWVSSFGAVFVGGIDARDGLVKVSGWEKDSGLRADELAKKARDLGIISIVYTNIQFDGTLTGPDIEGTAAIGEASGLPVIVSGGVSSLEDIERVKIYGSENIVGVITGKAVYEGRIDIGIALNRYGDDTEARKW